jgi:phycocyanin alpha chain
MNTRIEILQAADAQGRFLDQDELKTLASISRKHATAIDAARELTEKFDKLAAEAANAVYQKFPYTTQNEGTSYASTSVGQAKCVRDISYYLKMIIYCLVAGGTEPMDDYLLGDLKEINEALELSPSWYIEALCYIKSHHGLVGEAAVLVNSYIDYAIGALS